ncbi:MAG: sigma 54-interacting transcriptional regulator [Acidobacteria bacterium]|nr:sigma 54-interacting transcriptional regulator [Acidobacteriota bacterium]
MYLDLLSRVALTVAASRHECDTLLQIVNGLVDEAGFALARIWLLTRGAEAEGEHLELRASAGRSAVGRKEKWGSLKGRFSRFELGARKIGSVGSTGEPVLIENLGKHPDWIADPDWVARESMASFAAHPLIYQDQIIGVLGVFSRRTMNRKQLEGLRAFADHAAVSIANARAFEELQELRGKLELENTYLQEEVREAMRYHDIVGASPALARILQQVELVAPTDAAVLIMGESGTGKELIARAIHERSQRGARPLVKVNCASIPRELFESEFFGHVKGSFTGAVRDRVGRFQLADRGTLFLDEVGEIPLDLQSKLLRVLQEGEFERVGEDATRRVNVRVVAATNRDLGTEADGRRFRQDLYYRLSVFPIVVPPLRERREDIPRLAAHFIQHSCRRLGLPEPRLTEGAVRAMQAYDWPGNIRELQHVIERAVILGRGHSLPMDLRAAATSATTPERQTAGSPVAVAAIAGNEGKILTMAQLHELELSNYRAALKRSGGKVYGADGAAALLGIPPTTLASRLKSLGIQAGS